ncbi:hypothetical protein Calag_1339 [Caldisphaera lagunensis DSM 15908]|uniref:DNA repair protein n=1 Tax=Caldisphaera lagunensis (strain DSM 15908 / JCM 11604 / ANMR 0165 / IC-154) TaxID=1056495 RepID=L0AAV6_CALLD|nr:Nre family DNA repair protein [Caldisphaera lagunensis]AFZ71048.1 hypothetical protein Calag_1339 [Caldisphaera lagunensis DSM 15908]
MARIPPELCAQCKGYKKLCGLPKCPILEEFRARVNSSLKISNKDVNGSTPPSGIIGEYGYPKVLFHYMVPPGLSGDKAKYTDNPVLWSIKKEPLDNIVKMRSELVSATIMVDINRPWELYQNEIGLAIISERPVDSEVLLKKEPLPKLSFDGITKPIGPKAPAEKIIVRDNPKLNITTEKIIWDDLKAEKAIWKIYSSGIDIYTIQNMLSLGFLGKVKNRRLVPTRWSITAVDDIISNELRKKIRDFNEINAIMAFEGEYLSNRFLIIFIPGEGSFEWIEVWHPSSIWTKYATKPIIDKVEEDALGRVSNMDGGFSAARLSVLEYLYKIKRKANVIILREILPTYYAPVGNWHIRETVKNSLLKDPIIKTNDIREIILYIRNWVRANPNDVIEKSELLNLKKRKLTEFMNND